MVDALRRAHRMLRPDGCVIDVHPLESIPVVEVGATTTGHVDRMGDAAERHRAATNAVERAIRDHLFAMDAQLRFSFSTCGDSIDELRDYIAENWRDHKISERVVSRSRAALAARPGEKPRSREEVMLTKLVHARR